MKAFRNCGVCHQPKAADTLRPHLFTQTQIVLEVCPLCMFRQVEPCVRCEHSRSQHEGDTDGRPPCPCCIAGTFTTRIVHKPTEPHPYMKRHQAEAIAVASSAADIELAIVISLSYDGRHTFSIAGMTPESPQRSIQTLRKVLAELEHVEEAHAVRSAT